MCMLHAIKSATLFDDVYLEDPTTTSLESSMAALPSHEAGLLVLSGTMGNQVTVPCHLTPPPHSGLCEKRSHLLRREAGGVSSLSGAQMTRVMPSNSVYLTLEDVENNVIISDDIYTCPTNVIALEKTLAGTIIALPAIHRISAFAQEKGIKIPLDGARLWEAVAAGVCSISKFVSASTA